MGLKNFLLPLLGIFIALVSPAGEINLPQPYRGLVENILPPDAEVNIADFGGNFKAVVKQKTSNGFWLTNISSDDFISFYSELYETFKRVKPAEVSIKIKTPSGVVPYNPFYELWDTENNVKLLKFTRLKPGCKPPIVVINATGISGVRISVKAEEIYKKLFEGGFKKPVFYCY